MTLRHVDVAVWSGEDVSRVGQCFGGIARDSESTTQTHPGWRKGIRIGNLKDGKVTIFIPGHETGTPDGAMGEGIALDAAGNLYTAEATVRGVTKYVKK